MVAPRYTRDYSFSGFQANQPQKSLPGPRLDIELDAIAAVLGAPSNAADDAAASALVAQLARDTAAGFSSSASTAAITAGTSATAAQQAAAAAAAAATNKLDKGQNLSDLADRSAALVNLSAVARCAHNTALAAMPSVPGRVMREGFATPGDGGFAMYTYTSATPTADGGSVIAAAGGGSWILDPTTHRLPPQIWGVKGDSNGTAGNGTDDTNAIRAWIAYGIASGRQLWLPGLPAGRLYRITAPLSVTDTLSISGDGAKPGSLTGFLPSSGSILFFDHAGQGLVYSGGGESVIDGVCTYRAQPAATTLTTSGTLTSGQTQITVGSSAGMNKFDPVTGTGIPANAIITSVLNATTILISATATVSGSQTLTVKDFTPGNFDWDIVCNGPDLDIRHCLIACPTKGIFAAQGRIWIEGLKGHPLTEGIRSYALLDTAKWNDIHFWPYNGQTQEVYSWQFRNLTSFVLARMDNAMLTNISSIIQKVGILVTATTGAGPLNGSVNKIRMINIDLDGIGDGAGLRVDASVSATNPAVAYITNFTTQGNNAPGTFPYNALGIDVQGSGSTIGFFGYQGTFMAGNDISVSGAGNKITFTGQTLIQNWAMQNAAFPAISVAAGNKVTFGPFPVFDNSSNPSATTYFGGGHYVVPNGSANTFPSGSGKLTLTGQTSGGLSDFYLFGGDVAIGAGSSGNPFIRVSPQTGNNIIGATPSGKIAVYYDQTVGAYRLFNNSGADFTYYPEFATLHRVPN